MRLDKIIKNANIITMTNDKKKYDWIGIKDGIIENLGVGECGTNANMIIDADGATVLPAFSDCHVHVFSAGIDLKGVHLDTCSSIMEVLQKIEERCVEEKNDGWIFGVRYIPQLIKEGRYPTKDELDPISHGHKVVIFAATMHGCAVNTSGEVIAQVPVNAPGVVKKGGKTTGIYADDESAFIANINIFGSLSNEEVWDYIKACVDDAVTKGVTAMHGLFGQFVKDENDLEVVLEKKDMLPIDMIPFYQTWNPKKALEKALPRVGGCLTLDGALFEYTMANYKPFNSAPALRGILNHNDNEVYNFISKAHELNLQCTMHACGERAIDQLLYTYYRVFKEQGRKNLRHRLEHFLLPTDEQIEMAAEMDIIISMQPGFSYLWDQEDSQYAEILGRERANRMDPFNKVINAGITLIGGSDCPCTPVDPITDIATCVNGYNPVRNISVLNALKMYTTNPAYAALKEHEKGSLENGKDADIVIIDKDPYQYANSKEIYNTKVINTIKGGEIIYAAK